MRARVLIAGAAFGPDALKVMAQAFDEAWSSIASDYTTPEHIEAARLRLAQAMLSVASEDSRDVEILKHAALQVMRGDYSVPGTRQG